MISNKFRIITSLLICIMITICFSGCEKENEYKIETTEQKVEGIYKGGTSLKTGPVRNIAEGN